MSKDQIKQVELGNTNMLKDRVVLISLIFLLVFMILSWVLWVVMYRQSQMVVGIPVYFNFLQKYPFFYKYILPLFGSVVVLLHLCISFLAYNKEKLVSYLLIGGAAFLEVLILVTVVYYMSYA